VFEVQKKVRLKKVFYNWEKWAYFMAKKESI
jgi:hypothetical protein